MKKIREILISLLPSLIFMIWVVFIIFLLAGRRYMAFLRPEFGILLVLALIIAFGFMFIAFVRPGAKEISFSAIMRLMVLLVPVLYYVVMPNASLGEQAFDKRFVGVSKGAVSQTQVDNESQAAEAESGSLAASAESENLTQEPAVEASILDLLNNPYHYNKKRVIVVGMFMHDEQLKPYLGGKETGIYRFLVTCCAADAMPLTIALDMNNFDKFSKYQWVSVDGIFEIQQYEGKNIPVIVKPELKAAEAPAPEYLY